MVIILFILWILIILTIIYRILFPAQNKPPKHEKQIQIQVKNRIDYKKFYRPKRYVITKNELNFYTVLLEIAKELDLLLLTQVSLYNI